MPAAWCLTQGATAVVVATPSTQRCRWILFDAKCGTEAAERDLTKLQLELSKENVFAIQEEKG